MSSSLQCHYHPAQKITYFCLSQCTMPLCDICLIQHRKQNKTPECNKRIVTYEKAQKFAIEILEAQKSMAAQKIESFDKKYQNFKTEVMTVIQKLLNILYQKTKQKTFHLPSDFRNISQKIQNIQENDIKQIILVYLNMYKDAEPEWSLTYTLNQQIMSKQLESFIEISKKNRQLIDQLKKRDEKIKIVEKISESYASNPNIEDLKDLKQNISIKISQKNSPQSLKPDRKRHRGIFVASSPKAREDMLTYSCNPKQSLKESAQIGGRGTMNNSLHLQSPSKKIQIRPELIIQPDVEGDLKMSKSNVSQISQRRPATATAKYSSNNQTSFGFPEKVIILKESTSRKRLEVRTPMATDREREKGKESESERKRKQIDSVINRSDVASNSSSSRLIIKKHRVYQQCLNPQEMRQLLMKKNTQRNMGGSKILSDKLNLQTGMLRVYNR